LQDGKFLPKPFAIFEEIGRVIGVKPVPPAGGFGVEKSGVKGGYGCRALQRVLAFSPGEM
jgi:hypothetical protein